VTQTKPPPEKPGRFTAQLAEQPHAGHLFAFAAPVAGNVLAPVRLPTGR
jgi:hypothetical protein